MAESGFNFPTPSLGEETLKGIALKKIINKPFVLTGIFLTITIVLGLLPSLSTVMFSGVLFAILILFTILIFLVPLVFLAHHIQSFYGKSLVALIMLYIEGVILFGCAYFLLSYLGDTQSSFFGLTTVSPDILSENPMLLIASLVESVHFSLVTVSTVGFGNVYPKSTEALALTSAQILLGLYTVVIGISSALGVVVNKKIAAEEESRKTPLRLAAYEDISVFINRLMGLFVELHRQSVPNEAPKDINDFFTEEQMNVIYQSLNLNGKANVTPEQNWWVYLANESKNICDYGEKVLVRHAGHVEPEVYNLVHHLAESPELSTMQMLPRLKSMPLRQNFPPVLAANAVIPSNTFFSNMINLLNWCTELKETHSGTNINMRGLFVYNPNIERKLPPDSMYEPAYASNHKDIT